jgi:5,10-methylenetetrahydrofolate reductase
MLPFLRVVEVLPPLFRVSRKSEDHIALDAKMERFTAEVRGIRNFADVVLIANVKDQSFLKVDTVHAAAMLQDFLRVKAAPVIVARDHNRPQFLSTVLTAISIGLESLMIAWGDDYTDTEAGSNVRNFSTLAEALREASLIRSRARAPTKFFAPVDLRSLSCPKGIAMAKERLRAGADVLLAQPPTTDSGNEFERHRSLVEKSGLMGKVMLNVFPFRDEEDATKYEKMFGWRLPKTLHEAASKGRASLQSIERDVVRRSVEEGFPGIYLSTRGEPSLAGRLLA